MGLDTCVFSYAVQRHPQFGEPATDALALIRDGGGRPSAVLSEVVFLELQVLGLQLGGEVGRRRLEHQLARFPHCRRMPVEAEVTRHAALLRHALRLRAADALILATALVAGVDALVTNDIAWKRLPLPVYLLSDYCARKGTAGPKLPVK